MDALNAAEAVALAGALVVTGWSWAPSGLAELLSRAGAALREP